MKWKKVRDEQQKTSAGGCETSRQAKHASSANKVKTPCKKDNQKIVSMSAADSIQ